ncbi:MAG: condensation domain-containing protein, partial [Clostridium argentinense]|nr:condensation domain-containing protein [Clostridium argentinense]
MNELLKRISKLPPEKLKLLEKRIKENNIDINKNILDIKKNKFESIETVEDKEYYSLSSAQKRMYILNQIENVGVSYNIPMIMIIEGNLNINQFEKTISELVRRHESFRTAFQVVDGEPVQKIFKDIDVKITYSKAREDEIKSKIEEFVEPFDLSKAPLLRVELIKLSMNKHLFMMDTHHIVSDGVSMRIFIKDFINLYKGKELQELSIQYKDFSQWQNNILKTESIEKQREYWLGKFNDEIPVLNMPTDYVRPAVRSFEGDVVKFQIEKELVEDINKLASETGTT